MENRETEHTILDREEYLRGYRDGHKDGFEAGRNSVPPPFNPLTMPIGPLPTCHVCGATYPFGCQSSACPQRIGQPYITANLGATPETANDGG